MRLRSGRAAPADLRPVAPLVLQRFDVIQSRLLVKANELRAAIATSQKPLEAQTFSALELAVETALQAIDQVREASRKPLGSSKPR